MEHDPRISNVAQTTDKPLPRSFKVQSADGRKLFAITNTASQSNADQYTVYLYLKDNTEIILRTDANLFALMYRPVYLALIYNNRII